MYKKFHTKTNHDFEILAFPCNQFGGQEPDEPEIIKDFCENEKGVKFRMMEKVTVNGHDEVHDVYKFLKRKVGPSRIQWNLGTYFLVGKAGQLESYSNVTPRDLESQIASALRGQMIESSSLGKVLPARENIVVSLNLVTIITIRHNTQLVGWQRVSQSVLLLSQLAYSLAHTRAHT